jgi:hypothetical protein
MKKTNLSEYQPLKPVGPFQSGTARPANRGTLDFVPSADDVARMAYFAYVNESSPEGRDVQHWLMAEAELIAEHSRIRTHGRHNQN